MVDCSHTEIDPLGFGVNKTLTHDGDWIASLTAPANGTRGPPRRRLPYFRYNNQDFLPSSRPGGALKAVAIRRACTPWNHFRLLGF